jgi:arginyl-tRNA synthetase
VWGYFSNSGCGQGERFTSGLDAAIKTPYKRPMRLEPYLEELAAHAIETIHGVRVPALLRPADPAHGDYQVNGLMALAKRLGRNPRELAQPVADALAKDEAVASAEVAGPGFINVRLRIEWLGRVLAEMAIDRARDGVPEVAHKQKIVIDYSSPNIAKQMHVGHLRSTIIGAALYRLLRFVGHDVLGDNHIGDWGTQFGLLIVGMRRFGSEQALRAEPVQELERVYKLASAESKTDPELANEARAELAKLQLGDAENLAAWRTMVEATRKELDVGYGRLGVQFDMWRGESAYEDMLPGVVQLLLERGIAREDEGAICVFFEDDPELAKVKTPFIVRKKDGAFLYGTSDIATVLYRRDQLATERSIYVVETRQKLHFQQLFATMRKLGVTMELEHVAFGSVLGTDGKPLKTRAGDTIKLSELLDEAEQRATKLILEEGLEIEPAQVPDLARSVGIGAVKYADLSQNRLSDYRFDWDKLISFKGNAGPYLQYAHARVQAIFRKGGIDAGGLARETADAAALGSETALSLAHDTEIALAKQLARFPDVVYDAATSSLPHLVCDHLYAVARLFSGFYEQCPVLKAEPEQRHTRLLLCWLTARQLKRGLALLGIDTPERM